MFSSSCIRPTLTRRRLALLVAVPGLLFVASCSPDDPPAADPDPKGAQPVDAADAVFAAFDDHQIVGGFSAGHGNKDVDDFLLDLLREPRLPGVVDDIVIECGNSLYQDVLDRYVAGADVPIAEVRKVWRDTTQKALCGTSTFYERVVPLVRRINENLTDEHKLRVLAADPPVDWSQVSNMHDLEAFGGRDEVTAAVVTREVLAKDRTALMLFGINHMQHGTETAVGMYEAAGYEGVTYVIGDHFGFGNRAQLTPGNDELEARMADWPRPSIIPIEGSWLGELDSAHFNQPPGERGYPGVDAYLYVGPRDTLLSEPLSAQALLDPDYVAELERRCAIGDSPDGPGCATTFEDIEPASGALIMEPS